MGIPKIFKKFLQDVGATAGPYCSKISANQKKKIMHIYLGVGRIDGDRYLDKIF